MQRSLQLQLLTFLAALGTLGAALRPSLDIILFAVAFVFGTLLVQVRTRLEARREGARGMIGTVIGALLPWGLAALRAWSTMGAKLLPAKLSTPVIVAAAVVPTGVLIVDAVRALRAPKEVRQPD